MHLITEGLREHISKQSARKKDTKGHTNSHFRQGVKSEAGSSKQQQRDTMQAQPLSSDVDRLKEQLTKIFTPMWELRMAEQTRRDTIPTFKRADGASVRTPSPAQIGSFSRILYIRARKRLTRILASSQHTQQEKQMAMAEFMRFAHV